VARIAALVVAYYSSAEVLELSKSLAASTGGHEIEIYVIDNTGDADELAALEAIPGIARLVASRENLGYGGGVNALVAELNSEFDWYLVCNPDIRFQADAIDNLIRATDRHPTSALFGPRVVGTDKVIYPSARAFPAIRTGVGHALFANIWPANPWTKRYLRRGDAESTEDTEVDWLSGACLLVRPAAYHQVGGFDDGYFMYFEDVDLGWRLAKAGWTAMFVPSAHIVHSGAHSTRTHASRMRKEHHRSAERFLSRKYSAWWLAPLRWALRFALYVRREFFRG
jgi:N-acetylglucosaminyl-diphospho-decaprenol L-rhamnosyltransferase